MNRRRISILMIIVVVTLLVGCGKGSQKTADLEEHYIPVEARTVKRETIAQSISLNGKIFANEEVMVMPLIPGTVSRVEVKLGDMVEKDDILFATDQKDINKGLEQAALGVELAQKGVQQAENGVKAAQIQYESTKEKIDNALINLERVKALYEAGAVSKADLEQAELGASLKPLEALESQIYQAEIGYEQALNQLSQAQSGYDQAQNKLEDTITRAPITGFVNSLNIVEGELASNAQPAATIVDIDQVYLQANISERILNNLYKGQEVALTIPAALGEKTAQGTLDYISPTPDQRTQLYMIKVYLPNKDYKIKPGMSGSVKLDIESREDTLVVERNSIIEDENKNFVYIIEDNKAVKKEVVLGLDTGLYVELEKGLKEGDLVITKGQHYVSDGQQVKVVRGE